MERKINNVKIPASKFLYNPSTVYLGRKFSSNSLFLVNLCHFHNSCHSEIIKTSYYHRMPDNFHFVQRFVNVSSKRVIKLENNKNACLPFQVDFLFRQKEVGELDREASHNESRSIDKSSRPSSHSPLEMS